MSSKQMIPFHPLAELLPLLEGNEFAALVESIKSVGLLEPITLHEGKILDGRNRYRACLEANIEPRSHDYDGTDPAGFVLSRNLHRRHLTIPERAMIMAQYATLKNGQHKLGTGTQQQLTTSEVAKLAGISESAIKNAKVILTDGTPEEIASVRNGTSGIKPTAQKIRARRTHQPAAKKSKSRGARIPIPVGFSCLTDAVRAGIQQQRAGIAKETALKQLGLSVKTYDDGRDIVLLLERDDLSEADVEIVRRAAQQFDSTCQVRAAAELVKPIVLKVWGERGNRFKSDKSRLEAFCNSVSFVLTACAATSEMEIPHMDNGRRRQVLTELDEAVASLRALQARIKGGSK